MPQYLYKFTNPTTNEEDYFEIFQKMNETSLQFVPGTDIVCHRVPQVPRVIVDNKKPKTIGDLANKNTEKMLNRGDPRVAPKKEKEFPFWRDKELRNFTGKSPEQIQKYIYEGKL